MPYYDHETGVQIPEDDDRSPEAMTRNKFVAAARYIRRGKQTYEIQQAKLSEILCGRCVHGTVYRREGGQVTVLCGVGGDQAQRVPPDIVECTGYRPLQKPLGEDIEEMRKIALEVDIREGPPSRNRYL